MRPTSSNSNGTHPGYGQKRETAVILSRIAFGLIYMRSLFLASLKRCGTFFCTTIEDVPQDISATQYLEHSMPTGSGSV